MIEMLHNIWVVLLDTAFWLLIGLLAAGLIKTYIPENALRRWVGGKGFSAISRAALFGAPLPLCSCGVLPAAIGLHRAGASKEATVSFLISTPETSVDSVAVTYALMGPLMAVYRPLSALMSAMITGMLTSFVDDVKATETNVDETAVDAKSCCEMNANATSEEKGEVGTFNPNETAVDVKSESGFNANATIADQGVSKFNANETTADVKSDGGFNANETIADKSASKFKANETSVDLKSAGGFNANVTIADQGANKFNANETAVDATDVKSCCSSKKQADVITTIVSPAETSCCGSKKESEPSVQQPRWFKSLQYAGAELLDDISKWLAIGIVLAGIMLTFINPGDLAQWGSGLSAMLVMLVVGVPLYICAVASTPIAAGLLLAGVSPGAVLVFLLVGPATNIASFALVKQELGLKVTIIYLVGLSVVSLAMGLLLEFILATQHWEIKAALGHAHSMLPQPLAWGSAILLLLLAVKPLRRVILPKLG